MKKVLFVFGLIFSSISFASGTLEISSQQFGGVVPKNGVRIPFLTIHIASLNEEVEISEITVKRSGLSESSDISRLIAITDKFHRSLKTSFHNDDLARLRFRNPLTITPEEPQKITIYGNLNMTATSGRTISISLENIESNAENITEPTVKETFQDYQKRTLQRTTKRQRIRCKNSRCYRVQ